MRKQSIKQFAGNASEIMKKRISSVLGDEEKTEIKCFDSDGNLTTLEKAVMIEGRIHNPAPDGAAFFREYYFDDDNNPTAREKAAIYTVYEFDTDGDLLQISTYGFEKEEETEL